MMLQKKSQFENPDSWGREVVFPVTQETMAVPGNNNQDAFWCTDSRRFLSDLCEQQQHSQLP